MSKTVEESILFAQKYLEDLLSFFGLNTQVKAHNSEDEVIELHVPSTHLNGFLIGNRGETLHAIQFLVSSALKSSEHPMTRVNIDVAEYKQQRANRLSEKAMTWINEVRETGEPKHLKPMKAADRRTIHRLAGEHGLTTLSEGEGKDRHIVINPGAE